MMDFAAFAAKEKPSSRTAYEAVGVLPQTS